MNSAPIAPSPSTRSRSFVAIGLESVGKTQLLGSLTGRLPTSENFRGSTLACETYRDGELRWMDAPGIYRESETATTRTALEALDEADSVLIVARAGKAGEELEGLLPLVAGRTGFVVLTFGDRLDSGVDGEALADSFRVRLGVPVFVVDARRPGAELCDRIRKAATAETQTS